MSYLHIRRLIAVREEFEAARAALDYALTLETKIADIDEFQGIKARFVTQARRNVEATYLLRVFAEFESLLRDYRQTTRPSQRPVRTDMQRLIDSVATRLRITAIDSERVHDVRQYRNVLVHTGGDVLFVDFSDAFRYLCKFLSWLP